MDVTYLTLEIAAWLILGVWWGVFLAFMFNCSNLAVGVLNSEGFLLLHPILSKVILVISALGAAVGLWGVVGPLVFFINSI